MICRKPLQSHRFRVLHPNCAIRTRDESEHIAILSSIPRLRGKRTEQVRRGFCHGVSLRDVFDSRAVVMQSVPFCFRGAFRGASRVSLQAILRGYEKRSDLHITKGWKLFMLLTKKSLEERYQLFQEGRWLELLAFCRAPSPSDAAAAEAGRWNSEARGLGAQSGHLGEVVRSMSSPGRRQRGTLRELTNPARRSPGGPDTHLSQEICDRNQWRLFNWMGEDFLTCFRQRSSPRSGMIADHLFSILQNEADSELLVQVASKVGCRGCPRRSDGRHPRGQLTALAKARRSREGDRGRRHQD